MTEDYLTISNIILSILIFIHLCCEFFHYIHEFISTRKNKIQMNEIIQTLDKKCLKDCDGECNCKEEIDANANSK